MHDPTCSGVCRQGGDGVPRRTGEALTARFRIPPCFWVRLLQEARFPLGPKAHSPACRISLPSYYPPPLGERVQHRELMRKTNPLEER